MKKIFIAMLALAAAACTKSEVVSLNQEAIGFDNAFVENSTRSVVDPSYTNSNLFSDFVVYGYVNGADLFPGVEVSKSITNAELPNTVWDYNGTQYWIADGVYDFQAIAPKTNGKWTAVADSDSKDGISLSFTGNDGTVDLLYAKNAAYTAQASGNQTVGFTFGHVLSKVKFSFKNTYNADRTQIRVHSIKIKNAYTSATVALSANAPVWSAQNNATDFEFGGANTTSESADAQPFAYNTEVESHKELLLIPYNYGTDNKLSISFKYDIVVSNTLVKTFEVSPSVAVNLEPGKAYDFKTEITPGQPIEFTVSTISDWDNGNNTDTSDPADNVNDVTPID